MCLKLKVFFHLSFAQANEGKPTGGAPETMKTEPDSKAKGEKLQPCCQKSFPQRVFYVHFEVSHWKKLMKMAKFELLEVEHLTHMTSIQEKKKKLFFRCWWFSEN